MLEKKNQKLLNEHEDTNIYDTRIYIWSEKKSCVMWQIHLHTKQKKRKGKNEINASKQINANQDEKIRRWHFVVYVLICPLSKFGGNKTNSLRVLILYSVRFNWKTWCEKIALCQSDG